MQMIVIFSKLFDVPNLHDVLVCHNIFIPIEPFMATKPILLAWLLLRRYFISQIVRYPIVINCYAVLSFKYPQSVGFLLAVLILPLHSVCENFHLFANGIAITCGIFCLYVYLGCFCCWLIIVLWLLMSIYLIVTGTYCYMSVFVCYVWWCKI